MIDRGIPQCVCLNHERSELDRPAVFLPIILVILAGVGLLFPLAKLPCGLQFGSLIPYTAYIALATFSAQRGQLPYFFECPIVRQTLPALIRRHISFLITIMIVETIALYLKRYVPGSWLAAKGRHGSPMGLALWGLCIVIAMIQVFTNRSLLERAHLDKHSVASLGLT